MTMDHTQATERVLDLLDERRDAMVSALADLVAVPSVSGTDAENDAIAHMAGAFGAIGLDVDHWEIPLAETMARADFPGVEVDRREAWGVVGVLRGKGTGEGRSLMLNGHVDVVPDRDPVTLPDPTDPADPSDPTAAPGATPVAGQATYTG